MLTGRKPIKKSKQGRFQIIDTVDMMRPITKYSKQIVNGNSIPSMTREAFRIAQEERPGAVSTKHVLKNYLNFLDAGFQYVQRTESNTNIRQHILGGSN